jgi:hypothetical protein
MVSGEVFVNSLLASNLFFTSSLNASTLLYLASKPPRRGCLATAGVAMLLLLAFGVTASAYERILVTGAYHGAAALATTVISIYCVPGRRPAAAKLLAQMAVVN